MTWSTCDMVPYAIIEGGCFFFLKVLPNLVPYEMLTKGFVYKGVNPASLRRSTARLFVGPGV